MSLILTFPLLPFTRIYLWSQSCSLLLWGVQIVAIPMIPISAFANDAAIKGKSYRTKVVCLSMWMWTLLMIVFDNWPCLIKQFVTLNKKLRFKGNYKISFPLYQALLQFQLLHQAILAVSWCIKARMGKPRFIVTDALFWGREAHLTVLAR